MKKRLIRVSVIALLSILAIGAGIFLLIGRSGSGTLEGWIGTQIQSIANAHLNPQLSFTDLDYTYPFTVSLKNLHLTADDPAKPGKKLDIVACGSAAITLGEIPSVGKPIVIEKIILEKPLFSAVAVEPKSKQFIGFSNLVRGGAAASADEPKAETNSAGVPTKLSDIFRMKLVQLVDGKIIYDPRIPGTLPMELDQINTALNLESAEPGWYKLNTVISRKPVFEVEVAGQLNLDTFNVRDFALKMMADLGSDKLNYLPPELQELLKQYDARGKLNVLVVSSAMPVMDPMKGEVSAQVKLDGANVSVGDMRLPVDNLDLTANFADGKVTLPSLKIAALDGMVDLSGSTVLNDRLDADLHVKVAGMALEKVLAKRAPNPSTGKLDLELNIAGSLMSIIGKAPAPASGPLAAINLKNFRFSADDPVNPGQKLDVLACQNLDVALMEPILPGKPVVIEKIILDQPVLSAVAMAENSLQFAGIPANAVPAPQPTIAPAPAPVAQAPSLKQRLSDLIRVKSFQLNNAKLIYDPRIPGTQRMWMDQINTAINIDPANPDVYKLAVNLGRKPIFDLDIATQINVDALNIDDLKLSLLADLSQNQRDYLPPQLQAILKQTDATGKIDVKVAGAFPVSDPMKGKVKIDAKLENLDVASGNLRVPVKSLDLSAKLEQGKAELSSLKLAAMNSNFDISGSATLNERIDSVLKVKLTGVVLENLVAAIKPNEPAPKTTTKVDAELEVKTPVMVALGTASRVGNEPVATVTLRDARLSADDPTAPGKPLDFASFANLSIVLSALPQPGKPIVIDRIAMDRGMLRAVAMTANSSEFAGFANLQKLAGTSSSAPAQPASPAPAGLAPATQSQQKLSDLFQVQLVELNDAGIYYDPRIANTVPMSFDHINTKIHLDSTSGGIYAFTTTIPHPPQFNLSASGKINIDKLTADGLKLALSSDLDYLKKTDYYPPQIQQMLRQYETAGLLTLDASGSMPLTNPVAGDLQANVKLDNVKATAGDFRLPIAHVRLPAHLKDGRVEIQPADSLGGPMIEAFSGRVNLTGIIVLNDRMDSNLKLAVNDVQLKELMAAKKPAPPPKLKPGEKAPPPADPNALVGKMMADIQLKDAPLMVIAARATPPSGSSASAAPSPLAMMNMPDSWGSGTIQLREARLAGLELVQQMSNVARNIFADVFKKPEAGSTAVAPHETVDVTFNLTKDQVKLTKLSYEGEILAVDGIDGGGTITLAQMLDIKATGGPLQKVLNRTGAAGEFVKTFTNALLIFHVTGPAQQAKVDFERGDGKPVEAKVKELATQSGEVFNKGLGAVGTGLQKAGDAIGNIFNRIGGKKDDNGK